MAAEEASFNTSIEAISSGFMLFNGRSVGIPSITSSGSLLLMVPVPRTLMVTLLPGAPEEMIWTPAARPCKAWPISGTGRDLSSLPLTELTAPVRSFFVGCVTYDDDIFEGDVTWLHDDVKLMTLQHLQPSLIPDKGANNGIALCCANGKLSVKSVRCQLRCLWCRRWRLPAAVRLSVTIRIVLSWAISEEEKNISIKRA